jgi:hypothetical protein
MHRTPVSSQKPQRRGTFRPQVEALEGRLAPGSLAGALEPLSTPTSLIGAGLHRREPEIAVLAHGLHRHARAATRTTSDVLSFADGTVHGSSTLIRTDQGVSMYLQTSGLQPGAYTVWFVIFNHPEACVNGPGHCGEDPADFAPGGPAGFGFTYATGHLVGPSGRATFAAHLNEGVRLMDENLNPGEVFENARTAEIQLIVRYHGPAQPGRIYEQTHTYQPELGLEADVQFAVHTAR